MRLKSLSLICLLRFFLFSRNPLLLVLWTDARIFNLELNIHHFAIHLGCISTRYGHLAYVACSGTHVFGIWGHLLGTNIRRTRCICPKGSAEARKRVTLDGRRDVFLSICIQLSVKQPRLENTAPVNTGRPFYNSKPIKKQSICGEMAFLWTHKHYFT